ncbi:MAG: aminoacetone oxidase family FAD-binding enzyme [Clostridia bacterium]|nr:aminoacetone oxidase family FAD-binding enzyme [Clostridia bacterium]
MKYDVAVIGGGASGMACAVRLLEANKNLKICLIDAGERLGKKLAATGNGQGNVSNLDMTARHYHGGNVALADKIACSRTYDVCKLFDCLFTSDDKGRIYPSGRQASALCDQLIAKLKGRCDIMLATKVLEIQKGFNLKLSDGKSVNAEYVVFCVGGKAQKQFKTDGSAYALVTNLGHSLTPLYPSLVQFKTDAAHIKTLKGIRADCKVTAVCGRKVLGESRGDVIFTDYGVSGNAIFELSSYVADKQGVELSLEFLPDISEKLIIKNLADRKHAGTPASELLSGTLHNQLGRAVIARAKSADENDIAYCLKNFTLKVTGTLGFDYAQVTKGGINMNEITDELESKAVKNLFFAGEVLDIDGDCGGYNLQWAFTSGMAAADAILKRL